MNSENANLNLRARQSKHGDKNYANFIQLKVVFWLWLHGITDSET